MDSHVVDDIGGVCGLLDVGDAVLAAIRDASKAAQDGFTPPNELLDAGTDMRQVSQAVRDARTQLAAAQAAVELCGRFTSRRDIREAVLEAAAAAAVLKNALLRYMELVRQPPVRTPWAALLDCGAAGGGGRDPEAAVRRAVPPLADAVAALGAAVEALAAPLRADPAARFYRPPLAFWDAMGLLRRPGGCGIVLHGPSGLGKGALTRALRNALVTDSELESKFADGAVVSTWGLPDCDSGLCVERRLQKLALLATRLQCHTADSPSATAKSRAAELISAIQAQLFRSRALVVLEDVWEHDPVGFGLASALLRRAPAADCCVVVTTQRKFASPPDGCYSLTLTREANAPQAQAMLASYAAACPSAVQLDASLEECGKRLATACEGHPLLIRVVAGIVRGAGATEAAWLQTLAALERRRVAAAAPDYGPDHPRLLPAAYATAISGLARLPNSDTITAAVGARADAGQAASSEGESAGAGSLSSPALALLAALRYFPAGEAIPRPVLCAFFLALTPFADFDDALMRLAAAALVDVRTSVSWHHPDAAVAAVSFHPLLEHYLEDDDDAVPQLFLPDSARPDHCLLTALLSLFGAPRVVPAIARDALAPPPDAQDVWECDWWPGAVAAGRADEVAELAALARVPGHVGDTARQLLLSAATGRVWGGLPEAAAAMMVMPRCIAPALAFLVQATTHPATAKRESTAPFSAAYMRRTLSTVPDGARKAAFVADVRQQLRQMGLSDDELGSTQLSLRLALPERVPLKVPPAGAAVVRVNGAVVDAPLGSPAAPPAPSPRVRTPRGSARTPPARPNRASLSYSSSVGAPAGALAGAIELEQLLEDLDALRAGGAAADGRAVAALEHAIGGALRALGRPADALPRLQAALAAYERLPDAAGDTVAALHSLSLALGALGRHREALAHQQRAVAVATTHLGDAHPEVATALNNAALTLGALGRHTEALAAQRRALALRERALGGDHPACATLLNNAGVTLGALGRHEESLEELRRALAIRQKHLGLSHPRVGTTLHNIGGALGALRRHEEALEVEREALAVYSAALGPEHPDVATSLDNLGITLAALGRHEEALAAQERALSIRRAALGEAHPHVAASWRNTARQLAALGRHGEASDALARAAAISKGARAAGGGSRAFFPPLPRVMHALGGLLPSGGGARPAADAAAALPPSTPPPAPSPPSNAAAAHAAA